MCKFNSFCSYRHHTDTVHSEENKLQIEIKKLKDEVANLQEKVSLMGKILDSIKIQFVHDDTIIPKTYESENVFLNPDKVSPNKDYQRMMVDPMLTIILVLRSFLTAVSTTAVAPTAVIL